LILDKAAKEVVFVDDIVERLALHGLRHLLGLVE
jgi:hypothetical protein